MMIPTSPTRRTTPFRYLLLHNCRLPSMCERLATPRALRRGALLREETLLWRRPLHPRFTACRVQDRAASGRAIRHGQAILVDQPYMHPLCPVPGRVDGSEPARGADMVAREDRSPEGECPLAAGQPLLAVIVDHEFAKVTHALAGGGNCSRQAGLPGSLVVGVQIFGDSAGEQHNAAASH